MPLKLYTDKHIAKQISLQLRKKGVDIIRCEEVGMMDASDEAHLEYATQENRAVVSIDHHFPELHSNWQQAGREHAGIFRVLPHLQGDDGIGAIVNALFEFHEMVEGGAATIEGDVHNQMLYISG